MTGWTEDAAVLIRSAIAGLLLRRHLVGVAGNTAAFLALDLTALLPFCLAADLVSVLFMTLTGELLLLLRFAVAVIAFLVALAVVVEDFVTADLFFVDDLVILGCLTTETLTLDSRDDTEAGEPEAVEEEDDARESSLFR